MAKDKNVTGEETISLYNHTTFPQDCIRVIAKRFCELF